LRRSTKRKHASFKLRSSLYPGENNDVLLEYLDRWIRLGVARLNHSVRDPGVLASRLRRVVGFRDQRWHVRSRLSHP